jgi:DNA-binding transcriptional ArsR family regulator
MNDLPASDPPEAADLVNGPVRPVPADAARREPTAAEAKALGHPLRLRILFACRDRARTNKELAEALDTTPGTIHYHLKPLLAQGFLRAEEPRPGPRGSTEQPYRSTGKSWQLSGTPEGSRTLRQAGVDELLATSEDDLLSLTRLGMSLAPDDVAELVRRIAELVETFAARSGTPTTGPARPLPEDVESVALFVALHRTPSGVEAGEAR